MFNNVIHEVPWSIMECHGGSLSVPQRHGECHGVSLLSRTNAKSHRTRHNSPILVEEPFSWILLWIFTKFDHLRLSLAVIFGVSLETTTLHVSQKCPPVCFKAQSN